MKTGAFRRWIIEVTALLLLFSVATSGQVQDAGTLPGVDGAELARGIVGRLTIMPADQVATLADEMAALYGDGSAVKAMLEAATKMYGPQG